MPVFSYKAREARSGKELFDSVTAVTEEAAIDSLLKRDLLVVSIEEKNPKKRLTGGGKVRLKELVVFTRQLATMIDAGMAVMSALAGLAKQTKSKIMREVITDVSTRIAAGDSLSDALARHPKVFSALYMCMVAAGEKGGMLAEVLARLATYLENTARLQRKIKSALMYPATVTVVAIGITIFLLVEVVPVFGDIFSSFGGKLPAPTLALINLSNFVKSYFIAISIVTGAAIYAWLRYLKTKSGREFWDAQRIKLPIFGNIAHSICLARWTRTFASLVRSGVPILGVLETVSKACGNVMMEKATLYAARDIQDGQGISDAIAKHPIFPDMIIRMMSVGEQTGKLDVMLERIANYLDEEIETVLSGLSSLIEPILIVFLGVVVGGIVICMFLPIFKLASLVSGH